MNILKDIKFWWYTSVMGYPYFSLPTTFSEGDVVKWLGKGGETLYGEIIFKYKGNDVIKPISMYFP